MTTPTDMDLVVSALRRADRLAVTTHENPDGDALGSLLGLHLALRSLGKDSVMVLGEQPLPEEYAFLDVEGAGLLRSRPDDAAERVLVAVDCAQESRIAAKDLIGACPEVVNVDHHHDNTRFGTTNLVVGEASSTGEVLVEVLDGLGVAWTPPVAEALYTAIVTDTGRFQYANTTPAALRVAARLVEEGANVTRVFQGVYESLAFERMKLLGSALGHATLHEDGRVVIAHLTRDDFAAVGLEEPDSEGVIDHLRAVHGTELAVLIRELQPGGATCKVSLRASTDALDVSAIARQSGGGGHRQAAGFSSALPVDGVRAFVLDAYRAARAA